MPREIKSNRKTRHLFGTKTGTYNMSYLLETNFRHELTFGVCLMNDLNPIYILLTEISRYWCHNFLKVFLERFKSKIMDYYGN